MQCPKCGAEYDILPDVCEQCGFPLTEEEAVPDPFAAALAQEQKSRAEQQAHREAYQKRGAERSAPQSNAAEPQNAEQKNHSQEHEQKKSKKPSKGLIALCTAAVIGLFVYAGFSMRGDFGAKAAGTESYAFYLEGNHLCLYRDDTGKTMELTPNGKPYHDFSDSFMQETAQISEDGSRVYYLKNFTESNYCCIAYRDFEKPDIEHTLAEIMIEDVTQTVDDEDRPDAREAYQFVNMLPPYIRFGETFFYRNIHGALCRKTIDGEETVLSKDVTRFWQIEGEEGIYYLNPYFLKNGHEETTDQIECTEIRRAWYVAEVPYYECTMHYCSAAENAEPEVLWYGTPIVSWNLPYADSSRYFYFVQKRDRLFEQVQADLLDRNAPNCLNNLTTQKKEKPSVLCAYPDGSCYYIAQEGGNEADSALASICYTNRSENRYNSTVILSLEPAEFEDQFLAPIDFCRTEPFLCYHAPLLRLSTMGYLLYHRGEAKFMEISDDDDDHVSIFSPLFDTQYPMLMMNSALSFSKQALFSSSSSIAFAEKEEDHSIYYMLMNDQTLVKMQKAPFQCEEGTVFAWQESEDQPLEIFGLDANGNLLMADDELPYAQQPDISRIFRQKGGLYGYSKRDQSLLSMRNRTMTPITPAHVLSCRLTAKDTVYAVCKPDAANGIILYLCTPEQQLPIANAEQIISVGQLPKALSPES